MKFTFNGITSDEMGLSNVYIDKAQPTHPLGGAKSITTSKAMYSYNNIITKVTPEPITFSLTFTAMNGVFTPLRIREIYSYFDVSDYAKLSFQSNPDFYYNVMPMTNQPELNLYCGDVGYFTIDFVCDAHHGWIDKEYNYEITGGYNFKIYNESNVKNEYGNYLVFPTVSVNLKKGTHFGMSAGEGEKIWLRLSNLSYTYDEKSDEGLRFTIDNLNKQIYNETTQENLLTHLSQENGIPQYNFIGLQEGHTYLGFERLSSEELLMDVTIKVAYPVVM